MNRVLRNLKLSTFNLQLVICFSLFTVHHSLLSAQNRKIDSLRSVLKAAQTDTGKVNALNNLCEAMWRTGYYDSSMANALRAKAMAEKIITSTDSLIIKAGKNGLAGADKVI